VLVCFYIDPDGIIQAMEVLTPPVGRRFAESVRQIQAFQPVRASGGKEATPAGWEPGKPTLKPGPAALANLTPTLMIEIIIPGYKTLLLRYLVMDYNGTLAVDGVLLDGVRERLMALSEKMALHVVTADTFGIARSQLTGLPCELAILPVENQAVAKLAYIQRLGEAQVVAMGNGRNDQRMLQAAALAIAIIQGEGAALETCQAADVLAPDIQAALDLLLHPKRLIATLRS
jgi:soluble P-type ATPase